MQATVLILSLTLAMGLANPVMDESPAVNLYWSADNSTQENSASQLHRQASTRDVCDCGYSSLSSRIVGGAKANSGEVPWQVQVKNIYYNKTAKATYEGLCGGTIISPNYVLSATHCFVDNEERGNMDIQEVRLHVGAIGKNRGTLYYASNIYSADYNPRSMTNDFTLVKLQSPFKFNKNVGPACLPYEQKGKRSWTGKVWASGWGDLYYEGQGPNDLQKVVLDVISNQDCNSKGMQVQNSQMCTYTRNKDTCQGDSGGPIAARLGNRKFSVMGIVSYGQGCAGPTPGVYTRVSEYLNAIESTTGENFCKN